MEKHNYTERMALMTAALDDAKAVIHKQQSYIQAMQAVPNRYGRVVGLLKNGTTRAVVATGEGVFENEVPESVQAELGSIVRVNQEGALIGTAHDDMGESSIYTAATNAKDGSFEADTASGRVRVCTRVPVAKGDRVLVDGGIAWRNIGKADGTYTVEATRVGWNDIGGLGAQCDILRDVVEGQTKHAELYERYGRTPPRGVLLYGPPGCGKTLIGKAVATAIAKLAGEESSDGFLYVKGPELLNMYVGNTEAAIRALFARAKEHHKKAGYRAVIFLDEADALLRRRGSGVSSDMDWTVVPSFLAEMDGATGDHGATVMLATNRADTLDPAVVRDGRIDRRVRIPRPDKKSAIAIFKLHLANKPVSDAGVVLLAKDGAEAVFSRTDPVCEVTVKSRQAKVQLQHLVSGALIAGIAERAAELAMRREMKSGKRCQVTREDMVTAVEAAAEEQRDITPSDDAIEAALQESW